MITEFGGNHQSVYRLFLKQGAYVCNFEPILNNLANEVQFCARVFCDKKSENEVHKNKFALISKNFKFFIYFSLQF